MASPKGRRRWTVRLVLLGAVVWLLGWRGLGWLSGPGGDRADQDAAVTGDPPPAGDPAREVDEEVTGANEPREGRSDGDGDADGGNGAGEESPPPPGGVAGGEDRIRTLFRQTRLAEETGMLGGGFQALDELDGLPIAVARREESREARADLEEHLREGVAALREEILAGRLLAARRRLGDLLRIPHTAVARALDSLAHSRGWPVLRDGDAPPGYVPEPRPLPADRFVRFYRGGIEVRARVVDSTAEEVTVHLRDERGVTYPSLRLGRIELPEATAVEAAEMGLAALRAGDSLLARLWLCLALERGGGPRCRELAEVLG